MKDDLDFRSKSLPWLFLKSPEKGRFGEFGLFPLYHFLPLAGYLSAVATAPLQLYQIFFASLGFTVTFAIIYLFLIIHHCSYDLRACLCSALLSAILVSWDRNIAPFLGLCRLVALQHGFRRSSELALWYHSKY